VKFLNNELFSSACTADGLLSEEELLDWVISRSKLNKYSVTLKPLDELKGWHFEFKTGDLIHSSGKFFRVEGLEVIINSNDGTQCWQQPIINQPEIGILGFLAQNFNGVLHLLVQAKMEPGNINFIQISPTVQATRSNYTQVHGGKKPAFIEYFLEKKEGNILVDQLQSEQGTRYLRKRNRNIIVELPDNILISHSDDYKWVTVGQLQKLMRFPNLVHLDCRSILGSLSYKAGKQQQSLFVNSSKPNFNLKVRESIFTVKSESNIPSILSWLTQLKSNIEVKTSYLPLNKLTDWNFDKEAIRHESGCFFSVVGVEVTASNREVTGWCQPLVQSIDGGIIGLATQMRDGVLHFLIQGRVEACLIDILELAATVQCTPKNYLEAANLPIPAFVDLFESESLHTIHFDSELSDEGGRFYHSKQRHVIIELDENINLFLPPNYCWMTLGQIQEFAQFSNLLNIELRSIISCISLAD
jgi:oxidase EvaA